MRSSFKIFRRHYPVRVCFAGPCGWIWSIDSHLQEWALAEPEEGYFHE